MSIMRSLAAGISSVTGARSPFLPPTSSLNRIVLEDLYPDADPDTLDELLPLDRRTAMNVPAIAKARHMIVTAIAGLPLLQVGSDGTIVPEAEAPLTIPDPGRPRAVTLAWTVDAMFHYGRAWWVVLDRLPDGRPRYARWVAEHQVTVDRDGHGVELDGKPIDPADLIRFDAIHGGILHDGGLTIRRARRTEAAAARAADNPVASVELHQVDGEPMQKDEIDELIRRWADARRGKNGGVAYSNQYIEVRTHGQPAEQLLIDGRNASALDIARVCGVPAWAVDASVAGSSLTYSNVPSRSRELLDYTLRGYLDAITGRLDMDDLTPHGRRHRFDVTRLLAGDFRDRMEAGKVAIEAGIYDAAEIRDLDDDIH